MLSTLKKAITAFKYKRACRRVFDLHNEVERQIKAARTDVRLSGYIYAWREDVIERGFQQIRDIAEFWNADIEEMRVAGIHF